MFFFFFFFFFFNLKGIVVMLIKSKVQYNITKYFGSKTLNMRKQKHILSQFLVSVTLTLIDNL